jgi:hypothetical protein
MEKCRWDGTERVILFNWERYAHWPNFASIYYLEKGIIVLVEAFTSLAFQNWLVFA